MSNLLSTITRWISQWGTKLSAFFIFVIKLVMTYWPIYLLFCYYTSDKKIIFGNCFPRGRSWADFACNPFHSWKFDFGEQEIFIAVNNIWWESDINVLSFTINIFTGSVQSKQKTRLYLTVDPLKLSHPHLGKQLYHQTTQFG